MTALHLPPPKRGPRFGDLVYIGGTAMPIEALPLYQPDAPKEYLVEAPNNVPRRVAWDGLKWSDTKLSDEGHGDQEKAPDLPQAGSIPASSKDSGASPASSGVESRHAERTGKSSDDTPAGLLTPSESRSSRRSARPARKTSRKGAMPHATDPLKNRANHVVTEVRSSVRPPASPAYRKDSTLPPEVQALHDALDKARARRHADEEAYFAAITAVDQADPYFYRGRIHPLELLPRHVVPATVDLAEISARMRAEVFDLGEAA